MWRLILTEAGPSRRQTPTRKQDGQRASSPASLPPGSSRSPVTPAQARGAEGCTRDGGLCGTPTHSKREAHLRAQSQRRGPALESLWQRSGGRVCASRGPEPGAGDEAGRGESGKGGGVAPAPEFRGERSGHVTTGDMHCGTVWAVWTRFCEDFTEEVSRGLSREGHLGEAVWEREGWTLASCGLSCGPQIHVLKS